MKSSIATVTLAALLVVGGTAAIDSAAAATKTTAQTTGVAKATDFGAQRRTHRGYRHYRYGYRPVYRPYYLARPTYYVPAPFPLGFGLGFFW